MTDKPTYEEAKKARDVLLAYLRSPEFLPEDEFIRDNKEFMLWLILSDFLV